MVNNVTSLHDKKKEKVQKQFDNIIEDFGKYIDEQIEDNIEKVIDFSDKLYKAIIKLKTNSGIDVTYIDCLNSFFAIGFRRLNLTGHDVIVVGGYGGEFKIYDMTNIFNSLSNEENKEYDKLNNNEKEVYIYKKITKDFLRCYNVTSIQEINTNYEVF